MNERIRELVEKSYIYDKQNDSSFFNKEKFAQSIVQECASIVDLHGRWILYDKLAVKIKKHFGVEE